jgi:pimeloyl-ACP methyl ester carboxylesterase
MTTWTEWRARSQPLVVDGLELATYDLGLPTGRPLTFLHGYPSASVDIAPVLDRLDGWRVVTLDLPGFGGSSAPMGHPHSIHAAADAVEALWAHLGVDETLLVAHDYSVSVAQELLARRADGTLPVTLTGVVWMNGGLYPDLHRPTLGQQILLDPDQGAALAAAMTREMFLDGLRGTWGERIPMADALVEPIWESMAEGGGVARMHELLHYIADRRTHEGRWRSALEGSDLPMTFVWGDLDPVSGAHMIARVEERLPRARIQRLADVGHWPLLEAPDDVAAAIGASTVGARG